MKRSAMKKSTKPMNRGKQMKTKPRKQTKITKSARGQECTIMIPSVCNYNPETVVWCHSNDQHYGKGLGLKAHDEFGAYGCSSCHAVYDRQATRPNGLSKEDIDTFFLQGMEKSREILLDHGLI